MAAAERLKDLTQKVYEYGGPLDRLYYRVQTRSEESGIREHKSLALAFKHAKADQTVWKISFTLPYTRERVRLVRFGDEWIYEDIIEEVVNAAGG